MNADGKACGEIAAIDGLLAAVLRGERADWPENWPTRIGIERILYHGIAGLIASDTRHLSDWPLELLATIREQAIALAMWELRHKDVLARLLATLAGKNVLALVLKGSAVAYDLYAAPGTRARGDTDLLVAPADLTPTRTTLAGLGYRCQPLDTAIADDLALQEVWSLSFDEGTTHHIDLHWQLLNAPALRGVLPFGECAADPHPLPHLSANALAMSRVNTLLHTCVHRAMHLTSPYMVNGVTYYGGDRLIWAKDIDLLAGAFSEQDWRAYSAAALGQGVARVCLDGLETARRLLGTAIPAAVRDSLGAAGAEAASAYLLNASQARRALRDVLAIRGWTRKLAYLGARALPTTSFMRAKYPHLKHRPLASLHVRRVVDLLLPRPDRKEQG